MPWDKFNIGGLMAEALDELVAAEREHAALSVMALASEMRVETARAAVRKWLDEAHPARATSIAKEVYRRVREE